MDGEGIAEAVGLLENRSTQRVTKRKREPLGRQNAAGHATVPSVVNQGSS
jgi:hypothetical protein